MLNHFLNTANNWRTVGNQDTMHVLITWNKFMSWHPSASFGKDAYCKIEADQLHHLRLDQRKLRVFKYILNYTIIYVLNRIEIDN